MEVELHYQPSIFLISRCLITVIRCYPSRNLLPAQVSDPLHLLPQRNANYNLPAWKKASYDALI
jgi:hypothetical protein